MTIATEQTRTVTVGRCIDCDILVNAEDLLCERCTEKQRQKWIRSEQPPTQPREERGLVKALREVQLRLCQARLASDIGNKSGRARVDFLLGEIGRIEKVVNDALAEGKGVDGA